MSQLPALLAALPAEWRGTTFDNSDLLGRERFAARLAALLERHASPSAATGDASQQQKPLDAAALVALGNAEDYLRVSSNVSTALELALGLQRGLGVRAVLSFASRAMPVAAAALAVRKPITLHVAEGELARLGNDAELALLRAAGADIAVIAGLPPPGKAAVGERLVLATQTACAAGDLAPPAGVAGVVADVADGGVLFIYDEAALPPPAVLVIRKRMATPLTTPAAERALRALAKNADGAVGSLADGADDVTAPSAEGVAAFHAHLQELSGAPVSPDDAPVVFTAGLPALASLWAALGAGGGVDVLMCSTAYGGSSQVTDLFSERVPAGLRKHTFDIQGRGTQLVGAIGAKLTAMAQSGTELLGTTLVMVEIPTNPDMKVPNLTELVGAIGAYKAASGKDVVLLVDTTFAPGSKVLAKLAEQDPELAAMVFVSMSKSVSRGRTTAGGLVANGTELSRALLARVRAAADAFDTVARIDQLGVLVDNHEGVEGRCAEAYGNARTVGAALVAAVRQATGADMPLAFVSEVSAEMGFTSPTFSFNLPPPAKGGNEAAAALAQRFVDLLCRNKARFKPCVSFGQDNGLVYATVPATSTQGAIKAEDKAKQAVGGVQLVRLSFPVSCDREALTKEVEAAVKDAYA